jgi:hypothetical protein
MVLFELAELTETMGTMVNRVGLVQAGMVSEEEAVGEVPLVETEAELL